MVLGVLLNVMIQMATRWHTCIIHKDHLLSHVNFPVDAELELHREERGRKKNYPVFK